MRTLKTRPILTRKPSDRYIADAIAILGKYGGSLWVPDPRYSRVSSDGSGPQTDTGSDVGYVRDLCASYGSELVSNGDFSQGTTGWTVFQPTAGAVTFDGTKATVNSTDGSIAGLLKTSLLVVGKVYELSFDVVVRSGQCIVGDNNTVTYVLANTTGKFKAVFTATSTALQIKRGAGGLPNDFDIDNISVREIIGRPLFQATTGFKPKLKRVPKKLGPELAPATTSTTGWTSAGAGVLSSDGTALSVSNGGPQEGRAQFSGSFKANTTYALTLDVTAMVNGSGAFVFGVSRIGLGGIGAKSFTFTPTAPLPSCGVASNSVAVGDGITFKNISVREVLEWGWAWVFDGTDDLLATVSQPAITGETFIAAGKIATASVAAAQALMSKRTDINGSFLRRETTGATAASVVQADGVFRPAPLRSPDVDLSRHVYTQKITASLNVARLDGVQSGQIGCAPNPVATSIQIGAVLAARLNGEIYAAAYAPVAIPDAELLIVERAMAQLAGVTI